MESSAYASAYAYAYASQTHMPSGGAPYGGTQPAREPLKPKNGSPTSTQAAGKPGKAGTAPAVPIVVDDGEDVGGFEEDTFSTYGASARLEKLGLKPHPDPVAEAVSLASVSLPETGYRLAIPPAVLLRSISSIQYQSIVLACARHMCFNDDGTRQGFYLGDGTGVGKGRQIAGLILENVCRGRTKSMWFSASADLAEDARRDFRDLGADRFEPIRLHDLKRLKCAADSPLGSAPGLDCGILFSTYDLLVTQTAQARKASKLAGAPEFGPGSRLQQLAEWAGEDFEGVIVFDECHKAKNCGNVGVENKVLPNGEPKPPTDSKTSRAVVELQRRLPKARVLYVSATGATDPENLCYMSRLGLWGEGTTFADKSAFVSTLRARGLGAMEMVAMELKQSGSYIARTLSFQETNFEQVNVDVSAEMRDMYDKAAVFWQDVSDVFREAKATGLFVGDRGAHKAYLAALRQLYASQMRFFRQLCTASKVSKVVEIAKASLKENRCCVIGLQSTGEARTSAAVAEKGGDEVGLDCFVEPASQIAARVINAHLPDCSAKNGLLERAAKLKLPKNPLDDLIDRLGGTGRVAELTGRSKRLIKDRDGRYHYTSRASEMGCEASEVNLRERDAFQSGRKLVAVISDAASAGISLHADRRVGNQRRRVHMTLELAWSADKTVQQLGRTHRANQVSGPMYKIISTNIAGESRFASAVARRLQQLGALTHGDRRASNAGPGAMSAGNNVFSSYGNIALKQMYRILLDEESPPEEVTPDFIFDAVDNLCEDDDGVSEDEMRISVWEHFKSYARSNLEKCGVLESAEEEAARDFGNNGRQKPQGDVKKLLNRLLAMPVEVQQDIFGYFSAMLDWKVDEAKKEQRYTDYGIMRAKFKSIKLVKSSVVFQDPLARHKTARLLDFQVDRSSDFDEAKGHLDEALKEAKDDVREEDPAEHSFFEPSGFYTNTKGDIVVAIEVPYRMRERHEKQRRVWKFFRSTRASALPRVVKHPTEFKVISPWGGFQSREMTSKELAQKYHKLPDTQTEAKLRQLWMRDMTIRNHHRFMAYHMVVGSVLPVLPTLSEVFKAARSKQVWVQLRCMRVETTDKGEEFIGAIIPPRILSQTQAALATLQSSRAAAHQAAVEARLAAGLAPPQDRTIPDPDPGGDEGDMGELYERSGFEFLARRQPEGEEGEEDAEDAGEGEEGGKKKRRAGARRKSRAKGAPLTEAGGGAGGGADISDLSQEEQEMLETYGLWEKVKLPALKTGPEPTAAGSRSIVALGEGTAGCPVELSPDPPTSETPDGSDDSDVVVLDAPPPADDRSPGGGKAGGGFASFLGESARTSIRQAARRAASAKAARLDRAQAFFTQPDSSDDDDDDAGGARRPEGAPGGAQGAEEGQQDGAVVVVGDGAEEGKGVEKKMEDEDVDDDDDEEEDDEGDESDVVGCICGVEEDDGERMVQCETCEVWQHTKCVGFRPRRGRAFHCSDCIARQAGGGAADAGAEDAADPEGVDGGGGQDMEEEGEPLATEPARPPRARRARGAASRGGDEEEKGAASKEEEEEEEEEGGGAEDEGAGKDRRHGRKRGRGLAAVSEEAAGAEAKGEEEEEEEEGVKEEDEAHPRTERKSRRLAKRDMWARRFLGREVRRRFRCGETNRFRWYTGEVVSFDPKETLWLIEYPDSDKEELDEDLLLKHLVGEHMAFESPTASPAAAAAPGEEGGSGGSRSRGEGDGSGSSSRAQKRRVARAIDVGGGAGEEEGEGEGHGSDDDSSDDDVPLARVAGQGVSPPPPRALPPAGESVEEGEGDAEDDLPIGQIMAVSPTAAAAAGDKPPGQTTAHCSSPSTGAAAGGGLGEEEKGKDEEDDDDDDVVVVKRRRRPAPVGLCGDEEEEGEDGDAAVPMHEDGAAEGSAGRGGVEERKRRLGALVASMAPAPTSSSTDLPLAGPPSYAGDPTEDTEPAAAAAEHTMATATSPPRAGEGEGGGADEASGPGEVPAADPRGAPAGAGGGGGSAAAGASEEERAARRGALAAAALKESALLYLREVKGYMAPEHVKKFKSLVVRFKLPEYADLAENIARRDGLVNSIVDYLVAHGYRRALPGLGNLLPRGLRATVDARVTTALGGDPTSLGRGEEEPAAGGAAEGGGDGLPPPGAAAREDRAGGEGAASPPPPPPPPSSEMDEGGAFGGMDTGPPSASPVSSPPPPSTELGAGGGLGGVVTGPPASGSSPLTSPPPPSAEGDAGGAFGGADMGSPASGSSPVSPLAMAVVAGGGGGGGGGATAARGGESPEGIKQAKLAALRTMRSVLACRPGAFASLKGIVRGWLAPPADPGTGRAAARLFAGLPDAGAVWELERFVPEQAMASYLAEAGVVRPRPGTAPPSPGTAPPPTRPAPGTSAPGAAGGSPPLVGHGPAKRIHFAPAVAESPRGCAGGKGVSSAAPRSTVEEEGEHEGGAAGLASPAPPLATPSRAVGVQARADPAAPTPDPAAAPSPSAGTKRGRSDPDPHLGDSPSRAPEASPVGSGGAQAEGGGRGAGGPSGIPPAKIARMLRLAVEVGAWDRAAGLGADLYLAARSKAAAAPAAAVCPHGAGREAREARLGQIRMLRAELEAEERALLATAPAAP